MIDLRKTKSLVQVILETKPETRNNDHLLYKEVLKVYSFEKDNSLLDLTLGHFLETINVQACPKFESVSRCRRKVQELHPELKAMDPVEIARMEQEKEFRSFALGVKS